MRVKPATPDVLFDVALHMRDKDYAEIEATVPATGRQDVAEWLTAAYGNHPSVLMAGDKKGWVAIGGFIEWRPNVGTLFMFANDRFGDIAMPLTRFVREDLIANAAARGVHRFEAVSKADYKIAHRWLRHLGLSTQEAYMKGFGKRGEDFIQLSMVDTSVCTAGSREGQRAAS